MNLSRSAALLARAEQHIPGGVNSPVRAFRSVGGSPPFMVRGEGCRMTDEDGNTYIDYINSWGPLILGHRFPPVMEAIRQIVDGVGTSFGAPTEREIALVEAIKACVPSVEMARLVNSGTEATMSALRVARGFTGRDLTIKFEGCYHGHVDSLLVKAGSGMATLGIADTAGVPDAFARTTLALPYNSFQALERAFAEQGSEIAAVIVEPVVGNMGCVPPAPGYLELMRELCTRHGALLIFDEVMTGFRLAPGGAQQIYGIRPDLSTFGKVIGGGLPIAAYGGRSDVMRKVAPVGNVYQAGTLSGNPLAVAAGLAMLRHLQAHPEVYAKVDAAAATICEAFPSSVTVNRVGSMFTAFFTGEPVTDFESAKRSDTARFKQLFHHLLERGVYFPPSQFEAAFVSAAHDDAAVQQTVQAIREFFV
jgi:glutamate-1-semialdehyde 2,1-aminomutase